MKELTECYNLIADLLNCEYSEIDRNKKLNRVYELLTEIIIESEK